MRLFEGTEFDVPPRCESCEKLIADCECPPPAEPVVPPEKQRLRIQTEKRKKGKKVTVVRDLHPSNDLANLLTDLKNHCGSGGTIKDGTVEIQGDHLERAKKFLSERGYKLS